MIHSKHTNPYKTQAHSHTHANARTRAHTHTHTLAPTHACADTQMHVHAHNTHRHQARARAHTRTLHAQARGHDNAASAHTRTHARTRTRTPNPHTSARSHTQHTTSRGHAGAPSSCARRFHRVHSNFDRVISAVVGVNIGLMLTEHYRQPQRMTDGLNGVYRALLAVYFLEMFVKVCAYGRAYFRVKTRAHAHRTHARTRARGRAPSKHARAPTRTRTRAHTQDKWNWFDALLLLASLVFFPFEIAGPSAGLSDVLRLARLLRIGRLVRVARRSKGLRILLNTLIMSLPALCNVSLLLFLIFFCYAVVAVELYSDIPVSQMSGPGLSRYAQFDSFPSALLTLFRMSTGENWNAIMHDVSEKYPFSPIFFVSFLYLVVYLMFNLYMSAIIQTFENICNQTHSGDGMLITEEVLASFRLKWLVYDPSGSNFIHKRDLGLLLLSLDFPLRPFVSAKDRLWLQVMLCSPGSVLSCHCRLCPPLLSDDSAFTHRAHACPPKHKLPLEPLRKVSRGALLFAHAPSLACCVAACRLFGRRCFSLPSADSGRLW
jgi:hypothetical protein